MRYLLTLKGRPPFRLAGLETYERLRSVAGVSLDLLATHYERLAQLYQGLQTALAPLPRPTKTYTKAPPGSVDIAYILEPVPTHSPRCGHRRATPQLSRHSAAAT